MAIVTDGLIGYWHYQQGVQGSTWNNIAPATKGQYNGSINGVVLQENGMYFDGVDDYITTPSFPTTTEFTLETYLQYGHTVYNALVPVSYHLTDTIRGNINLQSINRTVRWTDNRGSYIALTPTDSIQMDTMVCISARIKERDVSIFLNGVLISSGRAGSNQSFSGSVSMGHRLFGSTFYDRFKGTMLFTRLYNRYLSDEEIAQNYASGTAVGLGDDPPPVATPPSVTIVSQSRSKLSLIPPMDKSTLKFKFDQDVTDWAVMVLGSDYSTGTIAGSGKNVTKDVEIAVEITHRMLYQEGDNRINIYGRNSDGLWTPYD